MAFNPFSLRKNRYITTHLSPEDIHARLDEALRTSKDLNITYTGSGSEFTISRPQKLFAISKKLTFTGKGIITSLGKNSTEVCIRYKCNDLRYRLITTFCTAASGIIFIGIIYLFFRGGLKKSIQLALVMLLPVILNYVNIKLRSKAHFQAFFDLHYELINILDPDGEYIEDEDTVNE